MLFHRAVGHEGRIPIGKPENILPLPAFVSAILILLTLSSCNSERADEQPGSAAFPEFRAADIRGVEVAGGEFLSGFALVYVPFEENGNDLYKLLENYDAEYFTLFKCLAVFSEEKESYAGNWRNVVNESVQDGFRKIMKSNDIAFFKDGRMVYADKLAFGGRDRLLLTVHSFIKGCSSPIEFVQRNKPERFIAYEKLFDKYAKDITANNIYIIVISNIRAQCKKDLLINYLDKMIGGNNKSTGILIFDENFSEYELKALENNKKFSLMLFKLPVGDDIGLQKLTAADLGFKTNLMFIFDSKGNLLDSCHIFENCPFIENYF